MKKEEKVKLQKTWNHSHHLKLRPHTWKGVTHIQLGWMHSVSSLISLSTPPFCTIHLWSACKGGIDYLFKESGNNLWYYKPSLVASSHHCCYLARSWYSFFPFTDPLGNTCSAKVPKSPLNQPWILQFCVWRSGKCVGSEIRSTFVTQIYNFNSHTGFAQYTILPSLKAQLNNYLHATLQSSTQNMPWHTWF